MKRQKYIYFAGLRFICTPLVIVYYNTPAPGATPVKENPETGGYEKTFRTDGYYLTKEGALLLLQLCGFAHIRRVVDYNCFTVGYERESE